MSPGCARLEKVLHGICCVLGAVILTVWTGGCDLSTPKATIGNLLQSAPFLPEYDDNNNYIPYYQTSEMNLPRYFHTATGHSNGRVYAVGGSDERGLSALDTIEFFDQSHFDEELPPVASIRGLWIDTDIEGNPMTLVNGPRVLHTANELSNQNLLIVGGSVNLAIGEVQARAEQFDPETREVTLVDGDMVLPRFRHVATLLPSGDLMISGGQFFTTVTVIDEQIPEGLPGRERQETRFPSTERVELYKPTDAGFVELHLRDSETQVSSLNPRRGRADHGVGRLAGPDNVFGGSDDMYLVTAGMMTLSAVSGLAPNTKNAGAVGRGEADPLSSVEIFDTNTNLFTLISSVKLDSTRLNRPYVLSMGEHNDFTWDGVLGMGNCVLVTHGNADGACPTTPLIDQMYVASYTRGGGPASGIRLFEIREDRFLSHIQHQEHADFMPPARGAQVGRCATNPVLMARPFETVPGVADVTTWIYSLAGVDIFPVPGGCVFNTTSDAMLAGCVFDPFFNVAAGAGNNLEPRDLTNERRANPQNFLGIVGAWFTVDGVIDDTLTSWGDMHGNTFPRAVANERIWTACVPIGGVDGVLGTFDDRILLVGGGRDYGSGGEPTSPSTEIFLPHLASTFTD